MYIFSQSKQNSDANNSCSYFMDVINIASFIIGLQNLDLNATASDIDNQTKTILDDLHDYLRKQEEHLKSQDLRLEKIESILYGKDIR